MNIEELKIRQAVANGLKVIPLNELINIIDDISRNLKIINNCKAVLENYINEKEITDK
jgi:hypothetical protein